MQSFSIYNNFIMHFYYFIICFTVSLSTILLAPLHNIHELSLQGATLFLCPFKMISYGLYYADLFYTRT